MDVIIIETSERKELDFPLVYIENSIFNHRAYEIQDDPEDVLFDFGAVSPEVVNSSNWQDADYSSLHCIRYDPEWCTYYMSADSYGFWRDFLSIYNEDIKEKLALAQKHGEDEVEEIYEEELDGADYNNCHACMQKASERVRDELYINDEEYENATQSIVIKLTDEEKKSLTRIARRNHATPEALLAAFVADLTCSHHSGGGDERDLADSWLSRQVCRW